MTLRNCLPELPDVRDVLHVVGWCDKAFRYLASQIDSNLPLTSDYAPSALHLYLPNMSFEADCTFQNQKMHYRETPELIEITNKQQVCYRWQKGKAWAEVATEAFWLK